MPFLNELSLDMRVCEPIHEDTRQWDRGKLFATFTHKTCEEILSLSLNNLASRDVLVWKENTTNKFSLRIAYQVALCLKNHNNAEHSSA